MGTVTNMVKWCADGLSNIVDRIRQKMQGSALGHFDETKVRVKKRFGGFTMFQTVNTPIWISVPKGVLRVGAMRSPCGIQKHCHTWLRGIPTGITRISAMWPAVPTSSGNYPGSQKTIQSRNGYFIYRLFTGDEKGQG